ncbi:unnamed protein product [Caenorhabditis auriculariae]|uniref:Uncharacterized protein n=1 Tax=Caenorhabditis auriculariae TaxID=2777116 RepID=A0A8S1HL40_9PELO|nr:unnamed protein product [Caenorhabditis auriculariae]
MPRRVQDLDVEDRKMEADEEKKVPRMIDDGEKIEMKRVNGDGDDETPQKVKKKVVIQVEVSATIVLPWEVSFRQPAILSSFLPSLPPLCPVSL